MTKAQIKKFEIQIEYSNDFLFLNQSGTLLEQLIKDKFILIETSKETINTQNRIERVTLKLESINQNILNGNGNILKIEFFAFLPWYHSSDENYIKSLSSEIKHNIIIQEGRCTNTKPHIETINMNQVCVTKLRQIVIPKNQYNLNLYPNPAENLINITFSKPFDNFCHITIFNLQGEVVANLINSNLEQGEYKLHLSLNDIPSGIYICIFSDGNETIRKMFSIVK